jgi:hypothetical protein
VAQAAENGMYATAVVGAALLAIGAYRLFRGRSASPGQGAQSQVTWERARRAFDAANYGLKYHDPGIDPKLWKQLVEAARLAGQLHNPPSVRLDAEYAGILYLDQQGNVVSTTGVLGPPCVPGADSCSAAPMSTYFFSADVHLSRAYSTRRDFVRTLAHELLHSGDGIAGRAVTNFQDAVAWFRGAPLGLGPRHTAIYRRADEIGATFGR